LIGNKLARLELSTLLEQKIINYYAKLQVDEIGLFFHDFLCYFHMRNEIIQIVASDNSMIFYT
jgi:hypothetical protein